MIFLFIWVIICLSFSYYYGVKAYNNLKEEYTGKFFRVMMMPYPFDEKYYTEKGLEYRNKGLWFGMMGGIGFFIIAVLISI